MEQIVGTLINKRLQELKSKKQIMDKKLGLEMPKQTNHPLDKIIAAVCENQSFTIHQLMTNTGSDSRRGCVKGVVCYIAYKNGVHTDKILEALNIDQKKFDSYIRFSILTCNSDENYRKQVQNIELSIDHGFVEKVKSIGKTEPVKISHTDLYGKPPRNMTLEYLKQYPQMVEGNLTVGDVKI